MAKSDARFEYKSSLSRTDHDLSQRCGFTCAPGMELPIWFDFASPGDSYYMKHDLPLLRSDNLARPAMVDVKLHFETFFVPMQMIFQPFENFIFAVKPIQSNFYTNVDAISQYFPVFDYPNYVDNILNNHMSDTIHADAFRLADLMGLGSDIFTASSATYQDGYAASFFPWQLLAYHTIWYYYFRLDDKTEFINYLSNWDSSYNTTQPIGSGLTYFMEIHQRPWNFDYFTSMYRSPIVSSHNVGQLLPSFQYSQLVGRSTVPIASGGFSSTSNDSTSAFSSTVNGSYSSNSVRADFSTAMIRQMFANEKLAMITGRTKKNYDSQVLAHYGVHVPHDVKHDITMVHHDEYVLNIQQVTSLSATSDAALGELAGNGYASGKGEQFKFTAPCHGVMMTLFCVEPLKRYIGNFDRINAVSNIYDFPTPEFDRMGNVPMYRYESGYNITEVGFSNSDIIGWKERYYQYKRKYDKATHAFDQSGVGSNTWSAYMLAGRPFATFAQKGNGISQRPDIENRFYIERNAMDPLCLVNFHNGWIHSTSAQEESWDNSPWMVYARDPFIVNSFIKCKKVSWMSKDGEPIYNY